MVQLIQDLNGNHVIQKCLNRLNSEDARFIFESVGAHCVAVGTHRHGCCVLQRCIDHASGNQRIHLIAQITASAYHLLQDAFGNYVIQYICESLHILHLETDHPTNMSLTVDLGNPAFSQPLCHTLLGNMANFSRQKFSSNVVEKVYPKIATEAANGLDLLISL